MPCVQGMACAGQQVVRMQRGKVLVFQNDQLHLCLATCRPSRFRPFSSPVPQGPSLHRQSREQRRGATLVVHAERDFYKILGVDKSADKKKIKSAYRQLARKWHPVRQGARGG